MTGEGTSGAETSDAAAPAAAPAVEATGVRSAHPDARVALDGIHLRVAAGERVAVLGPNGAGKTMLMLHLNGILRPAAGDVRIGGRRVDPDDRRGLREIRRRTTASPASS